MPTNKRIREVDEPLSEKRTAGGWNDLRKEIEGELQG